MTTYITPSENEAGVAVEDCDTLLAKERLLSIEFRGGAGQGPLVTHAQAEAVLIGLLRWKLETEGTSGPVADWLAGIIHEWNRSHGK